MEADTKWLINGREPVKGGEKRRKSPKMISAPRKGRTIKRPAVAVACHHSRAARTGQRLAWETLEGPGARR